MAISLTVGAIMLFGHSLHEESQRSFREQQAALNRIVTVSLRLSLDAAKYGEAETVLETLAGREVFEGAQLLDADGHRLMTSPSDFRIVPELLERIQRGGAATVGDVVYSSEALLDDDGDLLGYFVLALTHARMLAGEAAAMQEILTAVIPALLLILGLCAWQLLSSERALSRAAAAEVASNQAKGDFLANMSHELRTPLTAVLGYSEILEEDASSEDTRTNAVAAIRRNGNHLLALINDILDLSKCDAGQMTLESIPCDLSELLLDVIAMLQARAEQADILLQSNVLSPFPRSIHADPTRLRQVLVNLVSNAIKFTERGSVTLEVSYDRSREHALCIAIVDTGIGIPKSRVKSLFEPFKQADSSTTRRFGGTGLGLAISGQLAERMGASLEVTSQEGVGSRFALNLAVAHSEDTVASLVKRASPAAPAARPKTVKILRNRRVLVAEDGRDNQVLIRRFLERWGADVTVVENGREAVDVARFAAATERGFDLVLMDVMMPVMDGLQVTSELRAFGYDVPIVALTANAMQGDREQCLEAGCTDYASKPIRRPQLEEIFGRLLPQREHAQPPVVVDS